MKVTLKKNSWHFRYYRFLTLSDSPPKTLCPYFWSLVFLTVALPVLLLARLFVTVVEKAGEWESSKREARKNWSPDEWDEYYKERRKKQEIQSKKTEKIGKAFFVLAMIALASMLVYGIIVMVSEGGWLKFLIVLGVGAAVAGILVGILWLLVNKGGLVIDWIRRSFVFNFFGGMISAAYNKACPMIDWQNETETQNQTNLA